MTVIKNSTKDKVEALLDASIKPMAISQQLELNYGTVKKFSYNLRKIIEIPFKISKSV